MNLRYRGKASEVRASELGGEMRLEIRQGTDHAGSYGLL